MEDQQRKVSAMTPAPQKSVKMPRISSSSKSKKSVLMTADPYHTPGYGGFCPQFKYQIGETFGHTTHRLLRDKNVASSGNLVLANTRPRPITVPETDEEKAKILRNRKRSWGNQKFVETMIPGYSGFIPKGQHFFGKRYTKNCAGAIASFEEDQANRNRKVQEMRLIDALQSGELQPQEGLPRITSRYQTPLRATGRSPKPKVASSLPEHVTSPYNMRNSDPNKKFMSGYRGFVPCSRGEIGFGFPLISHRALNEFTDNLTAYKQRLSSSQGLSDARPKLIRLNTTPIYLKDSGIVPNYTGHIPGQRYRFGATFGESTKDSLGQKELVRTQTVDA